MIVNTLLKILEKYSTCKNGVIVQFVTHKKETYWADEIHDDCILVTPIDKDGNPNIWQQKYFYNSQFKNWEKRYAFEILVKDHNAKTQDKRFGVPIIMESNYCTIQ